MESLKSFRVKRLLIILLLAVYGNLIDATDCNNHHEVPSLSSSSKYNTTSKLILSSNPTVQIQVVKLQAKNCVANNAEKTIYVLKQKPKFNGRHDDVSKENALKSIINALQGKPSTTDNYIVPPTHSPPTVFNPSPTNLYVPNENVQNHFVYNIQNHGIHHHYYGSPSATENTLTLFVPLKSSNTNKTTEWINDVPHQK
ncbi:hypothetical protein DOY81_002177 [Sarcophaga bullata]|nr:hypothetical protein DOY81_002177 [Sarcophaga bullata]